MNRGELLNKFIEFFGENIDTGGIRVFFAPGRVNLIGEHTDYNGGHVFPCALTLGTYAAVRLRTDRTVRFASLNVKKGQIRTASLDDLSKKQDDGWVSYPKGVLDCFSKRGNTLPVGFDVLYYGNIPSGAGLSSSASIEVVTALFVKELYHFDTLNMIDIAVLSQRAESNYVGVHCGIMDQFASAMGKKDNAIFLSTDTMKYKYVPLKLDGLHLVITNSKVHHQLGTSEYNKRHEECQKALKKLQVVANINSLCDLTTDNFESFKDVIMDPTLTKRARHVVYENARTIRAVNALRVNNLKRFGELLNESHASLRDDFEVSCPEIDFLVDLALKQPGVLGSRMTGAGFGGCTVSLIQDDGIENFKKVLGTRYRERYNIVPDFYVVETGDGARELT